MNRLIRSLAAAALGVALAGGANAQLTIVRDPSLVKAGHYLVEPYHTRIKFALSHLDFTTYYGDFTGASGNLDLNPTAPATSKVAVSIPTVGVSTTNAKLDEELKSADWLEATKYPTITFVSTRVDPTGPATAQITGDLTLHGVTKRVTLNAKFNAAGVNPIDHKYTAGFDAATQIRRTDFGVAKYVPLVGDVLDVTISAAFEKQN